MTHLKLRSCSVRFCTCSPVAAFFTSPTERPIPVIKLFLMRNNVNAALTSMPPIAIGRTMNRHTLSAIAIHDSFVGALPAGIRVGPMKYVRIGTKSPHASKPPLKFNEESFGPMM